MWSSPLGSFALFENPAGGGFAIQGRVVGVTGAIVGGLEAEEVICRGVHLVPPAVRRGKTETEIPGGEESGKLRAVLIRRRLRAGAGKDQQSRGGKAGNPQGSIIFLIQKKEISTALFTGHRRK